MRVVTRQIHLGNIAVGGGAGISVQSMTKTDTRDIAATVAQALELQAAGCDILRAAVPDETAARAVAGIRRAINMPLVADIHFDWRLAVVSLESGADALRINPGNIGSVANVRKIVDRARDKRIPIRIGVNCGSVEKDILEKHGTSSADALVESAMRHVRILEDLDYHEIKISVKASDVPRTLEAYRKLSELTDYPLHLGVTEAGTLLSGTVKSSVALGILLSEGIGDTIRVSLTEHPVYEVRAGIQILQSLGLRQPGADVVSCPTCGRVQIDVVSLAHKVESGLDKLFADHPDWPRPKVAVMGCMVNGPGEAREADIAIAGGKGKAAVYVGGKYKRTIPESEALNALLEETAIFCAGSSG